MPLNAKLHIETAVRNGKTILKNSFCTQPFRIANVTEDKLEKALHLMLMSSSPGILDGDTYDLRIDVGEECNLSIETQSFQRLFQMERGASNAMTVAIGKGSSFSYLPHPTVPHQKALFTSTNRIFLSESSTLTWGEVISCGRKLNGEVFQFSSFHGLTEIFIKGKLVVKENLLIRPAEIDLAAIGQLEGFTHQATLIFIKEEAPVQSLTEELITLLKPENEIAFGVSALPVDGLLVRLLGHKAETLFCLVKKMAGLVQQRAALAAKPSALYVV